MINQISRLYIILATQNHTTESKVYHKRYFVNIAYQNMLNPKLYSLIADSRQATVKVA
jgi:hypothetical protein